MDGTGSDDPCHRDPRTTFASYLGSLFPEGAPPVVRRYRYPDGSTVYFSSRGEEFEELDRRGSRFFEGFFDTARPVVKVPGVGIYRGFTYSGMNGKALPCDISFYIKRGSEDGIDLRKLMGEDADILDCFTLTDDSFEPKAIEPPEPRKRLSAPVSAGPEEAA